jgi:ankyrin repeat protein
VLAAGGEVNSKDSNGMTPLLYASDPGSWKEPKMLNALLDHGVNANPIDWGLYPMLASTQSLEIGRVMYRRGACC